MGRPPPPSFFAVLSSFVFLFVCFGHESKHECPCELDAMMRWTWHLVCLGNDDGDATTGLSCSTSIGQTSPWNSHSPLLTSSSTSCCFIIWKKKKINKPSSEKFFISIHPQTD